MNWKMMQWWAALTPTNKLITGLAIALIGVSTSLATVFFIMNSDKNSTIEVLRSRLENKDKIISKKDEEIARCKDEANRRAYQDVEYEREQKRRADSMYYALTAAREAVLKATKNANKQR